MKIKSKRLHIGILHGKSYALSARNGPSQVRYNLPNGCHIPSGGGYRQMLRTNVEGCHK
jgi:hypothetical protein